MSDKLSSTELEVICGLCPGLATHLRHAHRKCCGSASRIPNVMLNSIMQPSSRCTQEGKTFNRFFLNDSS